MAGITRRTAMASALASGALAGASAAATSGAIRLLNVSYDPTRELYKDINPAFAAFWRRRTGQTVEIDQSHGGSGKQARAVIDGLEADVVTLALAADIDEIASRAHLLPADWQKRLPFNSTPYTSTVVLVTRKGNPKGIHDWADLIRPGVSVIVSNPKTSGGARWAYLAAWTFGARHGGEAGAKDFVSKLYSHTALLPTGSRDATTAFAQRGQGDVLLAWENEAYLIQQEFGPDYEIVWPSVSILAEPPVALVDHIVDKRGTRAVAQAYLAFLYSPLAQEMIARHHFRPRNAAVLKAYATSFRPVPMVTIDRAFGGWPRAQATHFADGGVFDQIYHPA